MKTERGQSEDKKQARKPGPEAGTGPTAGERRPGLLKSKHTRPCGEPKGKRFPAHVVNSFVSLRASGMSLRAIVKELKGEFSPAPSKSTIERWDADPEIDARIRRLQRKDVEESERLHLNSQRARFEILQKISEQGMAALEQAVATAEEADVPAIMGELRKLVESARSEQGKSATGVETGDAGNTLVEVIIALAKERRRDPGANPELELLLDSCRSSLANHPDIAERLGRSPRLPPGSGGNR